MAELEAAVSDKSNLSHDCVPGPSKDHHLVLNEELHSPESEHDIVKELCLTEEEAAVSDKLSHAGCVPGPSKDHHLLLNEELHSPESDHDIVKELCLIEEGSDDVTDPATCSMFIIVLCDYIHEVFII